MMCEICGKEFKVLANHIRQFHNIIPEIYYLKYLGKMKNYDV